MAETGKAWCHCEDCHAEMLFDPSASCPVCGKKTLRQTWAEHVSIEDEYPDGVHVLVIRKSRSPLAGQYCSLHQRRE